MAENNNNRNPQNPQDPKRKIVKVRINLSWLYLLLLVGIGWMLLGQKGSNPQKVEWAEVKEMFLDGDIKEIHFVRNDYKGNITVKPDRLSKYADRFAGGQVPSKSPHFIFLVSGHFDAEKEFGDLNAQLDQGNQVKIIMENDARVWSSVLEWLLPLVLLFVLWGWMFRGMNRGLGGGGGGQANPFNVGKSTGKLADKNQVNVTFKDVAGMYGAKEEVMEIVDFLRNPKKYTALGGKIPKGALLVGPPGTGKTLLARTLATRLSVPFAIADATTITEAGYVGEDVENILLKLIQAADDDISAAEHGIIFLDEVDKIAKKGENVSITRDVSGEGVQQALLKIIEGTVASVPPQGGRKHPNQEMLKIDTRNILFICGGAFVGLDRIIEKRMDTSSMGFGKNVGDSRDKDLATLYSNVLPDDLIKFGLIPEFIGRLPIHVALNELHVEDLERILTEPKNSIIRQYQATMKLDNVELEFTKEAIHSIAQTAFDQKTGARGLRSIVETIMTDIMYDVPSYSDVAKIVIEESTVTKKTKPVLLGADGKAVDRKLLT